MNVKIECQMEMWSEKWNKSVEYECGYAMYNESVSYECGKGMWIGNKNAE